MAEQKGLNDNISPLTEQQRKYLGFLRNKVSEEKYLSIKTQVLGGNEYASVEDGSKVIEALKKEVEGSPKTKFDIMKDYITIEELLKEAHTIFEKISIETEVITLNEKNGEVMKKMINESFVVKATVTTKKGVYTAYGDANEGNTTKMVKDALLRMAETRAVARALRFATGVGKTVKEELSEEGVEK